MMKQNPSANKGFTLIELLVTMVMLGILVAAGVPGMQTLLANMSVGSTSDSLGNTIAYARVQAVSRVENVIVCPSTNANTCGGAGDWATGWIVLDGNGSVLRVVDNTGNNTTITGAPVNVIYDRQGEKDGAAVSFTVGSSRAGIPTRQVAVSNVGYITIN